MLRDKRILTVDDSPTIRVLLRGLLTERGAGTTRRAAAARLWIDMPAAATTWCSWI